MKNSGSTPELRHLSQLCATHVLLVIKKLGLTDCLVMSELSSFDMLHQWSTECKVCGKFLLRALTFSPLTMPTAVVHYCSSWRKSRLWAWCLLNRLYVAVTDHMVAATMMWICRGLVYCYFFGWTSVLRWWMQDQCTLLHASDITILWKSGGKS